LANQGSWAIKGASLNNEFLLINLVHLGGTEFKEWKFDINSGELVCTRALTSIKRNPSEVSLTSNKPYRILRGKGIELARDQHGRLVFRKSTDQNSENWQAVLREGKAIECHHPPYMFTAVRLRNVVIEIIDLNEQQNITYTWRVDPHSVLFIGHDMIKREQNINQLLKRFGR